MRIIFKAFFISSVCLAAGCSPSENKSADDTGTEVSSLLSDAPGEEAVQTHCLTCHSLQYIKMQPKFPKKTWEKIVNKMIQNFGAPIPDSTAREIVNYLSEKK